MYTLLAAVWGAGCRPEPTAGVTDGGPVSLPPGDTAPDGDTAPATGPVDPEVPHTFDEGDVLVIPTAQGVTFLGPDGDVVRAASWTELVGPCERCGGEGASADGDGLLLTFTVGGSFGAGGVARVDEALGLDFRIEPFGFPHDAVRDPADGTVLVVETTLDRLTWIAGDGASLEPVRLLDDQVAGWPGETPNGVERVLFDGRTLLVSSHRGRGGVATGEIPGSTGLVTCWDLTDPAAPELLWTFPPGGHLDTPHGAVLRRYGGRWWLVYAHTDGADGLSSVGLAVTDDPRVTPAYVADLVPGTVDELTYLRGVELTTDGWLWLTDSGGLGLGPDTVNVGRVIVARMPDLAPTGATGDVGRDQVFDTLQEDRVVLGELGNPFEGWIWTPTAPLDP